MTRRVRLLTALLLVFAAVPLLTASGNGGNSAQARAEHQRIVDFWTPERVAQAKPRDFVRNPGGGFSPAAKPPGGPGGGGGVVVSGSSWNGGGAVDGTTGKVLFAMDGSYWVCSASTVTDSASGHSVVLTAGHCIYDETNGAFATNWMFIPDYDAAPAPLTTSGSFCANTLHGCWTATGLKIHSGYASAGGFNDQAVLYDWGFVVLGVGGHDLTLVESEVGTQGISFAQQPFGDSSQEHAFGYPAAGKWKGNDLIYCRNTVDGDPLNNNDTYRMNGCKMTGGSSGGPWMFGFNTGSGVGTLFSVNSYGYSGVSAMHGPFFTGDTQDTYNAAVGGGGNAIIP